jgi:hypothetical protein
LQRPRESGLSPPTSVAEMVARVVRFLSGKTDVVLPSDYSAPRIQFLGLNKLIEASYLKGSSS